ncbi:MAG: VOC family protein [Planctomycetales bacterium]|nr:VOC family protein [Planctomycetales bacterium]
MANPIPADRAGVIPHLVCDRCADALEFYKSAFGAEELCRMPIPGADRILHAEIRIGDAVVMLADDLSEACEGAARSPKSLGGSSVGLHRYVEDCDAAVDRAVKAGASVLMPPQDMFWGDRYAVVNDPFGHQWSLATHVKDLTPEEMMAAASQCFPST